MGILNGKSISRVNTNVATAQVSNTNAAAPVFTPGISDAEAFDSLNIFEGIGEYGIRWELVDSRPFSEKELSILTSCEVRASKFGISMCLHKTNGKVSFLPIDKDSSLNIGDTPDVKSIVLKKLKNVGEPTQPLGKIIVRVDVAEAASSNEEIDFDDPFGLKK